MNFLGIAGDYVFHTRGSLAAGVPHDLPAGAALGDWSARCCACSSRTSTSAAASARSRCSSSCSSSSSTCCASCCSRSERAERLAVAAARRADLDDRDARAARPHDRAPLGRGRPLRPRDGDRACACRAAEQELAHTAGLLHDIGKFAFPDSILLADRAADRGDWEVVRRHPEDGARIVAPRRGLRAGRRHRARPPRALGRPRLPARAGGRGDPAAARMIAVADAYDVLTARDSYRQPSARRRRSPSCAAWPARSSTRGSSRRSRRLLGAEDAVLRPRRRRRLRGRARVRAAGARLRAPRAVLIAGSRPPGGGR